MARTITILTAGSLGDVLPFVALATGLGQAGYRVRLALPGEHEDHALAAGLDPVRLPCDFSGLSARMADPALARAGFIGRARFLYAVQRTIGAATLDAALAACDGAEAVIFHPLMSVATDIAEALGIPAILAGLQPMTPTAEFPLFGVAAKPLGAGLNRASYLAANTMRLAAATRHNRFRARLGLPTRSALSNPFAVAGRTVPAIYGFSPAVLPPPADWPQSVHVTGYWHRPARDEAAWRPDRALEAFLADGEPPVYVGFGSNPADLAGPLQAILYPALERAGLRAVLFRGTMAPEALGKARHVHPIGHVPHGALFRHVRAAVHQAGAGTTAAVLRAGLPSLTVPGYTDQYLWARRVAALGAGPPPLPLRDWSIDSLAARLRDLAGNPDHAAAARRIAGRLAHEDGVANAAADIASILADGQRHANPGE